MDVIRAGFRFYDVYLFPAAQLPQDLSDLSPLLPEKYFAPIFRREHDVIFAIPLRSVYKELHADRETGC